MEFLWKGPDESVVWDVTVPVVDSGETWNGETIYIATDTQSPNSIGDWAVQALFLDEEGHLRGQGSGIVKIRATSFHAVPQVGTLVILLSLFAGLGIFVLTKRKTTIPKIR